MRNADKIELILCTLIGAACLFLALFIAGAGYTYLPMLPCVVGGAAFERAWMLWVWGMRP